MYEVIVAFHLSQGKQPNVFILSQINIILSPNVLENAS